MMKTATIQLNNDNYHVEIHCFYLPTSDYRFFAINGAFGYKGRYQTLTYSTSSNKPSYRYKDPDEWIPWLKKGMKAAVKECLLSTAQAYTYGDRFCLHPDNTSKDVREFLKKEGSWLLDLDDKFNTADWKEFDWTRLY